MRSVWLSTVLIPWVAFARPGPFELTLHEAEQRVLDRSPQLKSMVSSVEAAHERAQAQAAALYPRLSLEGSFRYISNVPTVQLPVPGAPPLPFGANASYSIGPTLSYAVWDTGAARKSFESFSKLEESRKADQESLERQLLASVRTAYVRVQLALEEVRLTRDSRKLAQSQNRDIELNFRGGAASKLDLVNSRREVLTYDLQVKDKQASLSAALKDLLALIQEPLEEFTTLVPEQFKMDSLKVALTEKNHYRPPDDSIPQLKTQELLAESSELLAESQKASLYPTVHMSARASIDYPNVVVLQTIEQNTFNVALSMPLFEMDRTRHLAQEKRKDAESARFRKVQLKMDLDRDFSKATALLEILKQEQQLSKEDVEKSEELARIFYASYRGGKSTLSDVLAANIRALQAKIAVARVDAQILTQVIILRSISAGEKFHAEE